jgi:hypothetical protein
LENGPGGATSLRIDITAGYARFRISKEVNVSRQQILDLHGQLPDAPHPGSFRECRTKNRPVSPLSAIMADFAHREDCVKIAVSPFKEKTMATPQPVTGPNGAQAGIAADADDLSLGEQLMREAKAGHSEFLAGWIKFMEIVGIRGRPVGAKKLREMLLQTGINPNTNEFSQGIIAMREE